MNLQILQEEANQCTACRLHETRNKVVFGKGNPEAKLVFLSEAPGATEDQQGLPFVGRAGKLLDNMIKAMDLDLSKVYICNSIQCRPPANRKPELDEIQACSRFLSGKLALIQPKVMVTLGATALEALGLHERGAPLTPKRGKVLKYGEIEVGGTLVPPIVGEGISNIEICQTPSLPTPRLRSSWTCLVVPTYHPSYLLRNPAAKTLAASDLKIALEVLNGKA